MKLETLEKLLKTHFNIMAIETLNAASISDTLRQYSNLSGIPVYVWNQGQGLNRQDLPQVKIPQTSTSLQVLNHIQKNKQHHIFILNNFAKYLDNTFNEQALLNICPLQHSKVILVDKKIDLSKKFRGLAIETKNLFKMKLQRAA